MSRHLCSVVALALASTASAGIIAVEFTGGQDTVDFGGRTLGYEFQTNTGIVIDALGYFDDGSDGLFGAHEVGLWNSDGSVLLASATVPAGTAGALISGFRFVDIAPVFLAGGQSYLIGGLNNDVDPVWRYSTATVAPEIALGSTRFDLTSGGPLSPPVGTQGTFFDDGYFGPNFRLQETAIPEPATLSLLALGSLGLLRRPRKH